MGGRLLNTIIKRIHELFIEEAKNSPLLFNDLASMENYISESYSGRSIIELMQNADDAQSSKMYIKKLSDSVFIVANNGRTFTNDDILSLCRSGASTKSRKSNTIGYRGIGFKSVVNYAEIVHLVSGEIEATFSRELTKHDLVNADKVPLIRVPHKFSGEEYRHDINSLINNGYTTVFVFEAKVNTFANEINEFSSDYLIFLNYINEVDIYSETAKHYCVKRIAEKNGEKIIHINYCKADKKWLVIENTNKEGKTAVAFKLNGKQAVRAERDEAVIHSFLPTNDKLTIKFKINGDFSTDPSRTRVVQDQITDITNKKCAELIADIFEKIITTKKDSYCLVEILKDAMIDPLAKLKGESPNDIIIRLLMDEIIKRLKTLSLNKKIVLKPKGMSEKDFKEIVNRLGLYGIGETIEESISGVLEFLKNMGIQELSLEECLRIMKDLECSDATRATIIVKAIKDTRFGMSKEKKEFLSNAKLFRFESGVKSVKDSKGERIQEIFEGIVTEQLATNVDYIDFTKRIGLKEEQLALNNQEIINEHKISNANSSTSVGEFKSTKKIKKWRSVEKNVAAVLESLDNVVAVKDVSTQNIGYDLEAVLENGTSKYYEVKSVERLGDTISFSNNEYSTCVALKNKYYLAIAEQSDENISVCFIKNPVEHLCFEKRITRWDWMCGEYKGEVINTKME